MYCTPKQRTLTLVLDVCRVSETTYHFISSESLAKVSAQTIMTAKIFIMLEKIHDEEKNQISKVYQNKNERRRKK
jgi:hypothetical protein